MSRDSDPGDGCFLGGFFVIVVLNALWIGALVWLIVAVIDWLGRH